MRTTALLTLSALALTACVPAGPQASARPMGAQRQCFFAQNVNSYREAGERAVHLRVGVNEVWRLELANRCDIEWSNQIVLRTRGGGSTICSGADAEIIVPDRSFPQRCWVTAVRKLTPEQVLALPEGERP